MNSIDKQNRLFSRTIQLADHLLQDIHQRNLKPGETYLTTQEASRLLGVAGASANRALQLLEKRQIIRRSQRCGSIILDPPQPGTIAIDRVHFLIHDKYYRTEGVGGDGILLGIQSELPTSTVSHCFLSTENDVEQVSRLLDRSLAETSADAFILVRAPYEVQRILSTSNFPAVVYGGIYEGIEGFSQIDRNHAEAVRLAVDYLLNRQCQKIAVLMRQQIMPGDHQTLDTLFGFASLDTILRFTPSEDIPIRAIVHSLLSREEKPQAFLCQTLRQAECTHKVRVEMNIPAEELEIVVLTTYLKPGEETPFPHIVPSADPESIGRKLGTLLLRRAAGTKPSREVIPVRLVVPGR